MPYDPSDAIYTKVEIEINGLWLEVTSRTRGGRAANGVVVKQGRSDGAVQAESARLDLTLGNDDGYVTEGNPLSPWWPHFRRGCRIRVSLAGILVSGDAQCFAGRIDTIAAAYPGGEDSSVQITALGTLGTIGQGSDPLRSPMFRTMVGVTPGDYVPFAYWSMEDGAGSAQFASGLPGGVPMVVPASGVTLAADSSAVGSDALPQFTAGTIVSSPPIQYTDTGQWIFQFTLRTDTFPVAETVYARLLLQPGGTLSRIEVSLDAGIVGSPIRVRARGYDSAGAAHGLLQTFDLLTVGDEAEGETVLITVAYGGTVDLSVGVANATASSGITTVSAAGTASAFAGYEFRAGLACTFGHPTLFIDPSIVLSTSDFNREGLGGWAGEMAHERFDRLCREEGIAATVVGSVSPAMGPQGIETLSSLLRDCETTAHALMHDGGTDGALAFVCLDAMTNQDPALEILNGTLDTDVRPIWDNALTRNDVTSSRPGGTTARVTDPDHIALYGTFKDARLPNVETDDQVQHDAGWAVNTGTAAGPRYAGVGMNMRNTEGARYADTVLALTIGQRMTAAEVTLPSQHPPGGIDALVVGWLLELDADTWSFRPHCVPYAPYSVGVYGADPGGVVTRYDSGDSTLNASVTSSATTLSVAWTLLGWTHADGDFDISVGGERMTVTAVAGSSSPQTFTVVRAVNGIVKAHTAGATVALWDTPRYAL